MPPLTHVLAGWCAGNVFTASPQKNGPCALSRPSCRISMASVCSVEWLVTRPTAMSYATISPSIGRDIGRCVPMPLFTEGIGGVSLAVPSPSIHGHFRLWPGWGIAIFLALDQSCFHSSTAWSFTGWQNQVAFLVFAGWTAYIAVRCRRTPLEFVTAAP